ncbi:MAG: hypothetical protein K2M50_01135 [Treponemataceae bacterium]|nr:hypothetical protein [Treponema sp.]MDE6244242.1 hypothetical protein [Treponemataceae bacterium]
MKKILISLLFCIAVCGIVCAEADIQVDSVEFVGFGVDGKISLKDAKFDVFQGVYLKNNSNEEKSVYITLKISGYNYTEGTTATLKPHALTRISFPVPPSNYLCSDYVKVVPY